MGVTVTTLSTAVAEMSLWTHVRHQYCTVAVVVQFETYSIESKTDPELQSSNISDMERLFNHLELNTTIDVNEFELVKEF